MPNITDNIHGEKRLLMGNEAIARGAIEGGVRVASAYPGTPSTEILETLAQAAKERNIYVEWSVNEKVALEVAAAASFTGLRAISAMKQNGLNVASDFLANLNLTGTKGGLVLVVCDDPSGISSSNEQDSRHFAKILDLPLLEPATFQEAKDMTKWAFSLSEEISNICLVRSVTRISHARGPVSFGKLPNIKGEAYFDTAMKPFAAVNFTMPAYCHKMLHDSLGKIRDIFESSPFNIYSGPPIPDLLIITCGSGWLYSVEAVDLLSMGEKVGILKVGTTWPLPTKLIKKYLSKSEKILFIEEVDAFLENNVKEIATDLGQEMRWVFFGKESGHINPYGELNPDSVINAIAKIQEVEYFSKEAEYDHKSQVLVKGKIITRAVQLCAGCPHRATFWAIKEALKLDGRDGVVTGDIGCYGMGLGPSGYSQLRTLHGMGSGIGIATGMGKLNQFGFTQPVLATCGDSTFFHAAIPALINGVHCQSDFILVVLDNSGTAMTGFQPHPGVKIDATGQKVPSIDIEKLCRALDIPVIVTDPYDLKGTKDNFLNLLNDKGKTRVLISRRECALKGRLKKTLYKVYVDQKKCLGEECGCNRFCTRIFKCPGLIWDNEKKKASIDEAICIGCGVCTEICPQSAIIKEAIN
ncbi:MAG: 4Fe-4S binding protein [Dehalococcoidales bacterium]|nr:4Fe-4S binding protein [Dehalococcoidales bacterium]